VAHATAVRFNRPGAVDKSWELGTFPVLLLAASLAFSIPAECARAGTMIPERRSEPRMAAASFQRYRFDKRRAEIRE
jgi:hypothetical protein